MPSIPIIMPQLGESIAEATIVNFLVQPGEQVKADQDIIEVETNKATMNVTAPCSGQVAKFLIKLNESYPVGATLGFLEATKEDASRAGLDVPETESSENGEAMKRETRAAEERSRKQVEPTVR